MFDLFKVKKALPIMDSLFERRNESYKRRNF